MAHGVMYGDEGLLPSYCAQAAEAKCKLELPSWVSARPMLWQLGLHEMTRWLSHSNPPNCERLSVTKLACLKWHTLRMLAYLYQATAFSAFYILCVMKPGCSYCNIN